MTCPPRKHECKRVLGSVLELLTHHVYIIWILGIRWGCLCRNVWACVWFVAPETAKMQLFGECGLLAPAGKPLKAFPPQAPPFDITVLGRPSRLNHVAGPDGQHRAIAIATSDDVADGLLSRRPWWQMLPTRRMPPSWNLINVFHELASSST
jgi:hypothetical protein